MALASRSWAGAMSGVWKAPPTGRAMARLAPISLAMAMALSMASGAPAMTTWPGPLWLASQTSPPVRLQAMRTSSSSRPRTAAMVPSRSSAAACMASPRSVTSRTALAKSSTPAAVRAEYSPRLWPAWPAPSTPRRTTASRAIIEVTKVASWLLRVWVSSSAPACKSRRATSRSEASEASSTSSHEG